MPAEVRNVLGVALMAQEAGADVLAFSRDRDRDQDRERDVLLGVSSAEKLLTGCPTIVGGVAIEAIEAWILALGGEKRSHRHPRPKTRLGAVGIDYMLDVIDAADIDRPELDAPSLRAWLDQARAALDGMSD